MSAQLFLPTAATGNSLCLATFGAAGEIMGFFYPQLDFAQNVREAMHAVHVHGAGDNALLWCFADVFERSQSFEPGTNILVTRLRHREMDLTVETTDLLPPDTHALVRKVCVTRGQGVPRVSVMQYFKLAVGDMIERNAVYYLPEPAAVVQHFRDISLAVATNRPFAFHLGALQPGGASSSKHAMQSGRLGSSRQIMGNVDFAVAVESGEEQNFETTLVLAGAAHLHKAAADARRLAETPFEQHRERAASRCSNLLDSATSCHEEHLAAGYEKAVLALHDLYDQTYHTFIAAPEFDPGYGYSGGYGYCWPRDAAVSSTTAARIGFVQQAEAFFKWAVDTQLDDGHWFQRYWADGAEAPSWCVQNNELQLDQTCALLHAAAVVADLLGDRRDAFVSGFRESAQQAARAIIRHIGEDGMHRPSADLWECCHGSFAYTQAAVIAALREGQRVFDTPTADLGRLREAVFAKLWDPQRRCWARRIDPEGRLDPTLDSSCLGLIEPWQMLDLQDGADRDVALQTVNTVAERLSVNSRGGRAILRFENESYMGGGPGCVNTLWLALCRLRLAATLDGDKRRHQIAEARTSIDVALASTNPVGQLPELMPNLPFDYWAAPHGWASSLFIECVLALQSLE